jgi:CD36 family
MGACSEQRALRWVVGGLISAGVLLCVFALVFHTVSYSVLAAGLQYDAVIDSERSPGYEPFADQRADPTSVPVYYNVTFFHLRNAPDVASHGARPLYEEIGPFVYRYVSAGVCPAECCPWLVLLCITHSLTD